VENGNAIADAKIIPQAFFDEARERVRKRTRLVIVVTLVIVATLESLLVAVGIISLRSQLLEVAPLAIGLTLFCYLRRGRWYLSAACVYLASGIVEYAVTPAPARGSSAFVIAGGMLSVLWALHARSVLRYEGEIRQRVGSASSQIKPA
jgi:hypothetical protein